VDLTYSVSAFYAPDHATGVRPDDPAFGIRWPLPIAMINERDRTWPAFAGAQPGAGR
jgi:dTDP-4-dehydrorhamnose 3,5-epimerase